MQTKGMAEAAALTHLVALYNELSRPSANKLCLATQERGIPLTRARAREFTKTDEGTQAYAPGPKFCGQVVVGTINKRWAADLVDQKANEAPTAKTPSSWCRTSVRESCTPRCCRRRARGRSRLRSRRC